MAPTSTWLALLGGAVLGCAYSLTWAWPGTFIAVAILVLSVEREKSGLRAALLGATFGWAAYVGGFFWLRPTLVSFWGGRVGLSWLVWIAWGCWVALRFGWIAWGYRLLRDRRLGLAGALTLPWVVVEWSYPSVFPFYLASPLIDQTPLVQAAALGGPILVSAWMCGVSALLVSVLSSGGRGLRLTQAERMALLAATLGLVGYGVASVRALDGGTQEAPSMTVGLVQASVDVMDKRVERALSHRRHLEQSRALLQAHDVELLIWPETSYLLPLPREVPTSAAAVSSDLEIPLLFGGVRKDDSGRRFNSALLAGSDRQIRTAYDKQHLIPFAEVVPLGRWLPWWERSAPTLSRFTAGDELVALQHGRWRIATPICYETIRPGYVRALVSRTGANLLVSLTNDGWFGDSPEPRIHLALARFRAIEQRRYLIRATNTGISAIVDPAGRLLRRTALFEKATLVGDVRLREDVTPYAIVGDWPGYLGAIALLWLLIARRRR